MIACERLVGGGGGHADDDRDGWSLSGLVLGRS